MTLFPPKAIKGERRRSVRVTPDPLLTISLSPENQGIVLDLSHEGVGFLASSPIEEAIVQFEIGARSKRGSRGSGQLIWKDGSGKRAGLHFAELSDELRAMITELLRSESPQAPKAPQKKVPAVHPPFWKKSETNAESDRRILGTDDIPDMPGFATMATAESAAAYPIDTRKRTFYANAVTIGTACVVAVTIWCGLYSASGHRDALKLYSRLKQPVSAFVSAQINRLRNGWIAQVPSGQPAEVSASVPQAKAPSEAGLASAAQVLPPVAQAPLTTESDTAAPAAVLPPGDEKDATPDVQLLSSPAPQVARPSAPEIAASANEINEDHDPAQTQLGAAQELLQDDSNASNASKAAQLLWQAVEKGNSAAAIELADLYLSGHGVEKSCNQAVVLLTAAKSRKNSIAKSKLQSLGRYGCGANPEPVAGQQAASPNSESAKSMR